MFENDGIVASKWIHGLQQRRHQIEKRIVRIKKAWRLKYNFNLSLLRRFNSNNQMINTILYF
jgi:hypothetical protein